MSCWIKLSFLLIMNWFCKMIKRDEHCDFYDFVVIDRWNTHVHSTSLICNLRVYIVEALEFICLFLTQFHNCFKLWNDIRTLSKIIFKTKYLANLLWIVWCYYMKICEWLLGVEYDVYHNLLYFLLYLECEKSYVVIELYNEFNVGVYIYVDWLCNCWGIHICWVTLNLLMIVNIWTRL